MGASLAKELGLYNEEEIILPIVSGNDTPTGPKYRILHCDPRSATLGINRTPIQVECTPVPKKALSGLTLKFDKQDVTSQCEEIEDETDKEIIEVKSKTEEPVKRYLETDIDAIEQKKNSPETRNVLSSEDQRKFSPVLSNTWSAEELSKFSPVVQTNKWSPETDMPLPPLKHPRIFTLSTDPRSPASFEVTRSPIQVECSPGMFSLCSRIDSASFDMSDCESDDPSAIVSEIGESPIINIPKQPEEFKDWFESLENKMSNLSTVESPFDSSPKNTQNTFADRNLMKKKLFLTPESNKSPQKQKPRTPLGNVHNQLASSPKNLLRAKQWRGIEEERSRRGVKLEDENTPPPLPPLSHISSAPGKMIRKRNIADWDCDSTMFI